MILSSLNDDIAPMIQRVRQMMPIQCEMKLFPNVMLFFLTLLHTPDHRTVAEILAVSHRTPNNTTVAAL